MNVRARSKPRSASIVALALAAAVAGPSIRTPSAARAQHEPPGRYVDLVFERVQRTDGIVYGTAIDGPSGDPVELRLDLYEPQGDTAQARPVFVFAFGGGFVAGDRMREPRAYCELMARRGYVAAAIDYRINQGNIATEGIPAAVSDARQAVGWLREHALAHRLDPERIVLGGSSAGAITALFTAYTDLERTPGDGSEVAAVLDLWGGLYGQDGAIEAGDPPLAIVHGTEDRVVPFSEAEALRSRAEAVGLPHLYHPIDGAGHAPYMPAELMAVVAPFFHAQLWGAVAPTAAPTATAAPPDTPEPTIAAPTPVPTASATAPPPAPRWTIHLPLGHAR